MLIKPLYCLFVFIAGMLYYPNNYFSIFAGSIRYYFAKMVVISVLKLVFYDYSAGGTFLCSEYIDTELTYGGLTLF